MKKKLIYALAATIGIYGTSDGMLQQYPQNFSDRFSGVGMIPIHDSDSAIAGKASVLCSLGKYQ